MGCWVEAHDVGKERIKKKEWTWSMNWRIRDGGSKEKRKDEIYLIRQSKPSYWYILVRQSQSCTNKQNGLQFFCSSELALSFFSLFFFFLFFLLSSFIHITPPGSVFFFLFSLSIIGNMLPVQEKRLSNWVTSCFRSRDYWFFCFNCFFFCSIRSYASSFCSDVALHLC